MYKIMVIWNDGSHEVIHIEKHIDDAIQAVKEMRKSVPTAKTIPLFEYPKGALDEN